MALALFDMDGTIINGDTNDIFFKYLLDINLVDKDFVAPFKDFHEAYFKGTLKIEDFILYAIKPLLGKTREEIDAIVRPCVKDRILPKVKRGAMDAIKFHKERHDTIVIVTATVEYIIDSIAKELGIHHVIGAQIGFNNNRLEHKIISKAPYQDGKKIRLESFINEHNLSLQGSYGYGDSLNDIQMLEMVENKFAIDANDKFKLDPFYKKTKALSWL